MPNIQAHMHLLKGGEGHTHYPQEYLLHNCLNIEKNFIFKKLILSLSAKSNFSYLKFTNLFCMDVVTCDIIDKRELLA